MKPCFPDAGCSPKVLRHHSLRGMVRWYIAKKRPRAQAELESFQEQPIGAAVSRAALARDEGGMRFAHQRRLTGPALRKAEEILFESSRKLRNCRSFHELHELIKSLLDGVAGLGELYYYDTGLRIGANLNQMPRRVYLHRGTREGARALGLDWRAKALDSRALPKALWVLEPHEMEDFLCMFKEGFQKKR